MRCARAAAKVRSAKRWTPNSLPRAARTRHWIARATAEADARRLAQDVALAVQGALLAQHAPGFVFEAFCASRLAGGWGQTFGTLVAANADFDAINARALPQSEGN